MGKITVLKNTAITIDLNSDYRDNGWSIGSGVAYHDSCNSGALFHNYFKSEIGEEYKVKYRVSNISNGTLQATLGGVEMAPISVDGYYESTIIAMNTDGIEFWSDADLELSELAITAGETEYNTLVFNNDGSAWVGYVSYTSDFMTKFIDDFYTFKDGELWKHNVNDNLNSFYGVRYPSIITFYVNINPTMVKTLSSMRLNSNKPWDVLVEIRPREGKLNGQRSRIKRGNFKNLQGQWFADFLKDMNDVRFNNELEALFKGADLQGNVIKLTIEYNENEPVRLLSVDTLESPQNYTY